MTTVNLMQPGRTKRIPRRPRHTFNVEFEPFELQPFCIAPVLPGETMKNALLQYRKVSDPLANPLIGWWSESWLFYVKLRDLDGRDDFTAMMVDENKDMSSYNSAASSIYNHAAASINYTQLCLKRIVEEFFRDENEAWDAYTGVTGLPMCSRVGMTGVQSVLDSAAYLVDDFNVDTDADTLVEASEVDAAMKRWAMLRMNQLTDMSYEDYLKSYGVSVPDAEHHVPELLRYWSEWTYPTNTIDPADGSPSSAVSWAMAGRADKDRLFREPGFIIGVMTARPKIYFKNVDGNLADWMDNAYVWLPAIMHDDPRTSLRKFADATGPLGAICGDVNGYWIDYRDLFIYGDEFHTAKTATNRGVASAIPNPTFANKKYPSTTDTDNLFVTPASATKLKCDGVLQFNILGRQWDRTPGVPAH